MEVNTKSECKPYQVQITLTVPEARELMELVFVSYMGHEAYSSLVETIYCKMGKALADAS